MILSHPEADIYVPSGAAPETALARVTHLCIAAHQDDIEIMAHAGICDCLDAPDRRGFGGVVMTNGAGSPRTGAYAPLTDAQMQQVRRQEQRRAAELGDYAIQLQLAHRSSDVKNPAHRGIAADLDLIFSGCSPEVVYLHNPADKHDTHVAVLLRCIEALRRLPAGRRPARVLGCEVWRDLDWLGDDAKVALDSGRRPELAAALLKVFDSQISGG
ncbi:MAG TPA: PIG-L family deacetylase, partial [Opitutus sp.]|nr:PIG-L family deacetylase [Opitutus sp.]